jgi:hypothetical protein
MIEKRNHLLTERIRRLAGDDIKNWDKYVDAATRSLNFHEIDMLGFSPFQIMFGIEKRVMLQTYRAEVVEAISRMATDEDVYNDINHQREALTWRAETRELVKERNEDVALERKERHDRKLQGAPRTFEVGDLVMVLDKTEGKTKFDPRWRGPFQVIEKRYTAYRLKHLRHVNPYPGLFAPDHLRMYYPRPRHLRPAQKPERELYDMPPFTLRARRRKPA